MTHATCDGDAAMSRRNRYGQDRAQQRDGHFSGLHTFTQEDAACSISAGAIRDRRMNCCAAPTWRSRSCTAACSPAPGPFAAAARYPP